VTVEAVDAVTVRDYYSEGPIDLPVAIAELGLDGTEPATQRGVIETACRADLVTIDGQPLPIRVVGPLAGSDGLSVEACGDDGLELGPGSHELRTAVGRDAAIDVDRIVLSSAGSPIDHAVSPRVKVVSSARTGYQLAIAASREPFWLVLAQSHNDGWRATADGRSLGAPELVDGFANGWLIGASEDGDDVAVELEWTPQRWIWLALAASLLANLACLAVVALSRRSRLVPRHPERSTLWSGWPAELRAEPLQSAGVVAAVGLFGLAVATPVVAGVAAAVTTAASWRRAAAVVRVVPALMVALAGSYIALQQWRYGYPAGFEWPTYFARAHEIAWIAVATLVGIAPRDGRV